MFARLGLVALLSFEIASGQTIDHPNAAASAQAEAGTTQPIHFEVASIRRNNTGEYGGRGLTADGFGQRNLLPVMLVGIAYGVLDFRRIQGLPEWCRDEHYDINAKVSDGDTARWAKQGKDDLNPALQTLLQDRFHLKAHFESQDVPVYALVVAKNGPRLKAATPGDTYPNGQHGKNGKPVVGFTQSSDPATGQTLLVGQAVSVEKLVQYMNSFMAPAVGRPVVDKTGLSGQYDFSLPLPSAAGGPDGGESGPSIFTRISESLGLKLEPSKAPQQVLVVERIERPSEN